jgi:hypothetical protein
MASEYQLYRYRHIKERNKCVVFDDHGLYSGPLPPKLKRAIDILPFTELMVSNKLRWIQREIKRLDRWLLVLEMHPITDWNKKLEARTRYTAWITDLRQKIRIIRDELCEVADGYSVRMMTRILDDIGIQLTLIDTEFNTLVDTSLRAAYREIKGALQI